MVESLVRALRPGDHVCWAVRDDATFARLAAAFTRASAGWGHRITVLTHLIGPAAALAAISAGGVDVEALTAAGQLTVRDGAEVYRPGGRFDADAMAAEAAEGAVRARDDGFAGLSYLGDCSWAVPGAVDPEELLRYEAAVHETFLPGDVTGLCVYDTRRQDAGWLARMHATHPGSVDPDTEDGWRPMLRIRRATDGDGLALEGESDISNRDAVAVALATLRGPATGAPRPVIDLTDLRFADAGTVHQLDRTARRVGGMQVVGASAQVTRLLGVLGADPRLLAPA